MPSFRDDFEVRVKSDSRQLDDVADSLRKNAKATDEVGDKAKSAGKDVDRLDRSMKDLDESADRARHSLDDTGDSGKKAGDKLDKAGKDAGSAGGLFGKLTGTLGGLKNALGGLAAVGGIGFGAIFGGTVGSFEDIDSALNKVEAQTGANAEEMARFRDVAESLFAEGWGENFDAIASSMAQVHRVTGLEGESLRIVTERALIMAETFDLDVTEAIRTANNMATVFGGDAAESIDILIGAMQRTGDPAGDLLDTFNEFAPAFEDLGFGPLEMLAMLESGLDAGAFNAQSLADGVRELSNNLNSGAADTALWTMGLDTMNVQFKRGEVSGAEMFEAVRQGLLDIEDPMERNRRGVELFGAKWEELGGDVILAMDPAAASLIKVGDSTAKAEKALQKGMGPAATRFFRTMRLGLTTAIGPYIEQGLEKLIPLSEQFTDWLSGHAIPDFIEFAGTVQEKGEAAFAWFKSDALPVLKEFASMGREAFKNVAQGIEDLRGAFESGGLEGLGQELLNKIAGGLGDVGGWIDEHAIQPIIDHLKGIDWSEVPGQLAMLLGVLLSMSIGIGRWIGEHVIEPVTTELGLQSWADVRGQLDKVLDKLLTGAKSVGDWLTEKVWTPITDGLKDEAKVQGVSTNAGEIARKIVDGLVEGIGDIASWVKDNVIQKIIDSLTGGGGGEEEGGGVEGAGKSTGESVLTGIANAFLGIGDWLIENVIDPFMAGFTGDEDWSLKTKLSALPDQILEWLAGLLDTGKELGKALLDGIVESLGGLKTALIDLINDAIPNEFGFTVNAGILGSKEVAVDIPDNPLPGGSRDQGGQLKPGGIYGVGRPAMPELFVMSSGQGQAFPAGRWNFDGGGMGSGISIAGDLVLQGVQNVRQMRRELQREDRLHNVGGRRATSS